MSLDLNWAKQYVTEETVPSRKEQIYCHPKQLKISFDVDQFRSSEKWLITGLRMNELKEGNSMIVDRSLRNVCSRTVAA